MGRTLYLDCFSGISGNMFLGALLDLGLDFDQLQHALAQLGVEGFRLERERVDRCGISSTHFDVVLTPQPHTHSHAHDHTHDHTHDHGHSHAHDHTHDHGHSHAHDHTHDHGHSHAHDHTHDHEHSHTHSLGHGAHGDEGHRGLSEIKEMIVRSNLSASVKDRATEIFERIGRAESKIHDVPIETIHFHEVGAIDSIVDIIGACWAVEALGIERIVASPVHVGSGTFVCAHGRYPVPGPATAELLRGIPSYSSGEVMGELTTPTGAALVATLAEEIGPMPPLRIERIGYGAGTRTYPHVPNVLRAILGEPFAETATSPGSITVIEATIDDLSGEVHGYVMEQLLAAGALDVFFTPVQMKKHRPGILLTLLCSHPDRERLTRILFEETTTIGVRYRTEERETLSRQTVRVETPYGQIRVKISRDGSGRELTCHPEYEDCQAAARRHAVPLRQVQSEALRVWSSQGGS